MTRDWEVIWGKKNRAHTNFAKIVKGCEVIFEIFLIDKILAFKKDEGINEALLASALGFVLSNKPF